MKFPAFQLEEWFRKYYFDTEIMLCSSGVEEFSLGDLRELVHLSQHEMDQILFKDSPSYGAESLREAIAQRWRAGHTEEVLVTHGSSEAMFLLMTGLLQQGDEVIVLTPCYQPLLSIPEAIGCRVKEWRLTSEQHFLPNIADLKRLLTPATRMVVVNVPNNPTGVSLSLAQQEELIQAVAEVNAYLLWDSAFTELTYQGLPLPDPGEKYRRTITLGTLTKTYGLGGLRVGWCLATPDVLEQAIHVRDYITLNLSPLIEYIAQRAVENIDVLLSKRLQQSRANLSLLVQWVEQHKDIITWTPPQGGVCTLLKINNIPDIEAFCYRLAQEESVFLLPGSCFGYPEYVRIGFGGATSSLEKGLSRVSRLLRGMKQGMTFSAAERE